MKQEESAVHAGSTVTLREITADTVREITSLSVSAKQQGFVASNAVSIAQAHFTPGAWFRAKYADDTAMGFVMLFDPTLRDDLPRPGIENNEVALWRLMIDQRYQGKGFGRRALDLICAVVRSRPGIDRLIASCVPGPGGPEEFYLKYGFAKTGRLRNQDREIEISIAL